jgi:hypothetical protein
VTQWHAALAATAAAYNISSQLSGRLYAHAALAELDALTANARGARANETAVAALAAYRFFLAQFPNRQKEVDPLLARQLAGLAPGEVAKAAAVAYPAARKQALAAADNGAQEWAGPGTVRGANGTAGAYAFAPGQAVSLYPQLANVSLLALGGRAQAYADKHFGGVKPPALDSTEYAADAAGVSRVGGLNSTARSPRETETAKFWVDGDGTPSVAGRFFDIAGSLLPANATLTQTATLFARVGAAVADASAVCWALKQSRLFWRPVTALRAGTGGLAADPGWEPLLKTPPHPEFPSGHAVTASAAAAAIEQFFGTDAVPVTTNTAAPGFKARTYSSLRAAVDEVGASRVLGGVHFNFSVDAGRDLGYMVGGAAAAAVGGGGGKAALRLR